MYQEFINLLKYSILFDFENFSMYFWYHANWIAPVFLALWGIKLGARFLKQAFE